MKLLPALLVVAMLVTPTAAYADRIGVRSMSISAPERETPIDVTLWYPAGSGGQPVLIGDSAVFVGVRAYRDAAVAEGSFPVVLLSYGGLRAAPDLDGWIASRLAAQGYVVAALRRPRPVTIDVSVTPREIWLRPADLSATLTALEGDPSWTGKIDAERVAVLGMQHGGTSALALAGARIDPSAYRRSCDAGEAGLDCAWFKKNGIDLHDVDLSTAGRSNLDPRVKAAITIDPELTQVFTTESLSGISIPVDIINLGLQGVTLPALDAAELKARIPEASYAQIPDATRFDAFGECKAKGAAILREEGEDENLCEGGTSRRAEIHAQLAAMISAALKRHLQIGM